MNLEKLKIGTGETDLEIFLEPTCPHSKRAFGKLQPLLQAVGENVLSISIRLLSQPWHTHSSVVTRSVLAAFHDGGMEAGLTAMGRIYDNREEFVAVDHATGPVMDLSPSAVIARISELAGRDLSEAFRQKAVDRALRWHTRYARQNGAHSTPTFAIDGMITNDMSSGQSVEEWQSVLGLSAA